MTASVDFRIGLVGSESTHCDAYIGAFNVEERFPGVRIVSILGEGEERTADLMRRGGIRDRVLASEEMAARVDGVIIVHRRSTDHFAPARTFLEAGIPSFVDKPMAGTASEAADLIDIAARHGTRVTSHSVMPMQSSFQSTLRGSFHSGVTVYGPCDPASPWDGVRFYGLHLVELFLALGRPHPCRVAWMSEVRGTAIGKFTMWSQDNQVAGVLELHAGQGLRFGVRGAEDHPLVLDEDPYKQSVERIAGFLRGAVPARPAGELLRSMALLDAMEISLRAGGDTAAVLPLD